MEKLTSQARNTHDLHWPGGDVTMPIVTNDQSNIYHLKNKLWRNWSHKSEILTICIMFYCDMKPTRPWYPDWWRLLSLWYCMKQMFAWNFLTWLLPSSTSEVGLIRRRVFLLLNYIKRLLAEHSSQDAPYTSIHYVRCKKHHVEHKLFSIFKAFWLSYI
jgi:hypothetical protein